MRKACLALLVVLQGCVSQGGIRPLRPLEIATAPYRDVSTTAVTGSLMYEGGCLLLRDDRTHALLMPVWPLGSSFNGNALLVHHPGKSDQWVTIAQELLVSGEPYQWATFDPVYYRPFEHQCGGYAPFLVTTVRPAD